MVFIAPVAKLLRPNTDNSQIQILISFYAVLSRLVSSTSFKEERSQSYDNAQVHMRQKHHMVDLSGEDVVHRFRRFKYFAFPISEFRPKKCGQGHSAPTILRMSPGLALSIRKVRSRRFVDNGN